MQLNKQKVTILILIDGFLQFKNMYLLHLNKLVTILILIDGFLQLIKCYQTLISSVSHNPYFNRWFSAISAPVFEFVPKNNVTILILIDGFLQYSDI